MIREFFILLTLVAICARAQLYFDYEIGPSILAKSHSSRFQQSVASSVEPFERLNDTFIPSNYNLELLVLLDNDPSIGEQFTAPGKVLISGTPSLSISQLSLHAFLLTVNETTVKITNVDQPSEIIGVTGFSYNTADGVQMMTMTLNTTMQANNEYQIYIEFVAPIIQGSMYGLYLATYEDPTSGETKRSAATQMESIHARKLFPCFDEPALKATFDVSIIRKNNYTSQANGNLIDTIPDPTRPGWSVDTFNTTVPMSTYLFAIVVSDLTFSEADPELFNGKTVRVYGQPHMISRGGGEYSARISAEILQFYEDFFQAPYPLMKMDSSAIPQFAPGAMENYGLNLYRESLLIYYPGEDLETSRASITSVLAHELGHQNFGNWVSLNWWRQIWLNEGFATYVANLGVAAVAPEFQSREDTIGQFQGSMVTDASDGSHPLQNNVTDENPDGHNGGITYDKGASINRMTEKFLTEETFIKGLKYYLQDMKFKAAHSDDLFRNLDLAAAEDRRLPNDLTVKQILDTWTKQRGHPLVRVRVTGATTLALTQEKYVHINDADESLWYVPVTVVSASQPTLPNNIPTLWLPPNNQTHTLAVQSTSQWLMINQDATGYYRVIYDDQLLSQIHTQMALNASVISPLSRSQLLDDYFVLAFRDIVEIEAAMNCTKYMAQEFHFSGWNVIFNHLRRIYNHVSMYDQEYELFKAYLLPKLAAAVEAVGLRQIPTHIGQAAIYRAKLLDWSCSMDYDNCLEYAEELSEQWQLNPANNPITVDTQAVIECAIINSANSSSFDFIYNQYLNASVGSAYRSRLLNSLGCLSNSVIIDTLIEKALNPNSDLPRSDATTVLQRLAMNRKSFWTIFNTLEIRLQDIMRNIGNGSPNPIASIVSTMSQYMSKVEELDRLTLFVRTNILELQPVISSLQNSINTVSGNIQWMTTFGDRIVEWLRLN